MRPVHALLLATLGGCGRFDFAERAISVDAAPDADADADAALVSCTLRESLADLPADWTLSGAAAHDPIAGTVVLTPEMLSVAGSFVRATPLSLDRFRFAFDLQMDVTGGIGDGIGVMLLREGSGFLGGVGSGLGMVNLDGYGIELDSFENTGCADDLAQAHIGVDDLAPCGPVGSPPRSLVSAPAATTFADSQWHRAEVSMVDGAVTVTLDGTVYIDAFAIPGWTLGARWHLGLSAATGDQASQHAIKNLELVLPGACP